MSILEQSRLATFFPHERVNPLIDRVGLFRRDRGVPGRDNAAGERSRDHFTSGSAIIEQCFREAVYRRRRATTRRQSRRTNGLARRMIVLQSVPTPPTTVFLMHKQPYR